MMTSGSLLRSALVVAAAALVVVSGQSGEKLASCCESASDKEITEPILGYLVQKRNLPCVKAVIFQTETGLYCNKINSWALRKIQDFRRAKAQSTTSPSSASLLSIITSTTSPPPPSTPHPPSSSPPPPPPPPSSWPVEEIFSGSGME